MSNKVIAVRSDRQPERLVTEVEAAEYLSLTARALQNWRYLGKGPPFVRISKKAVRYRVCDLEEFVRRNLRSSTSDLGVFLPSRETQG